MIIRVKYLYGVGISSDPDKFCRHNSSYNSYVCAQ